MMKARDLRSIRVSDNILPLLTLPSPEGVEFDRWSTATLEKCLRWAREQWLYLLTTELSLPERIEHEGKELDEAALFSILIRNIGIWFNALNDAHRYRQDRRAYTVIFTLADSRRVIDDDNTPSKGVAYRVQLLAARAALNAYIHIVVSLAVLPYLDGSLMDGTGPYTAIESVAHEALVSLHVAQITAPGHMMETLCGRLMQSVLQALSDGYEDRANGWKESSWRPGPFSDLRLQELQLLALRHESMEKRYGVKMIERRFEQQLALLFQSLGFIVIQTRTGTRTADLVCISSDPNHSITFLVEAKTSKAPYSLPAKDERALLEYVREIDGSLTTLPRLRFVLLVSARATKTLAGKLRNFETRSGTPIRFITASALGQLRADLTGPAPVGPLTKLLLDSYHVLPDEFVKTITDIYRRQQDAHRQFAEALMEAGQSPSQALGSR
jgi:Restriction endonuclease